MKTTIIVTIASFLMLSAPLAADDQADLQKAASSLDQAAQSTEGRQRVLAEISKETQVPVATLETQRTSTKFGFGELLIAHKLAAATGKTFDQIAALKAAGKGWGAIAGDNNVKLGEIVSAARRAEQATQHSGDGKSNNGRGPSADRDNGSRSPGGGGGRGGGGGGGSGRGGR
jgi:hypothetical protein